MNPEEYQVIQDELLTISKSVEQLDLDGFVAAQRAADAAGPILDPALYMHGSSQMHRIGRLAGALKSFQDVVAEELPALRIAALKNDDVRLPGIHWFDTQGEMIRALFEKEPG